MKNYLKFISIISFIGLICSCSGGDSGAAKVDYTVYKNQTDDLDSDALQLNYVSSDNSHMINFYGNFDVDKNPTSTNTITYQETNSDTVVNLIIDPLTKRISSLFTTLNGVKSNVVMKFDYISDTELKVSFHEYDWITNTSSSIFLTKIIQTAAANRNPFYSRDSVISDFGYNMAALGLGVAAAEITAIIGGGWSAIGALSGAVAALVASASAVAIVGAAAIAATIFFINAANAAPISISDLVPPSNIPLQNPILPVNSPTNNLQQSPCFNSNISFDGSMDAAGSIAIFGVTGGVSPYTYLVGTQVQANPVFSNQYPNGSYLLGVKDASGCMSVKVIPLDRDFDSVVGTWKLNSVIDESTQTELGGECSFNNKRIINVNNTFSAQYYKMSNNTCVLEEQVSGTYTINNESITFSTSTLGSPETDQIILVTDNTLKLRYIEGQSSYIETYARQ